MIEPERRLSAKDYFVVSSMLFALFFGAGNLIFPLHLGQLAGRHWLIAAAGFLVTGVLLPLLSVLAVAITRADGVYEVGLPAGSFFALWFMVFVHATIGPLFGTPRTATVSYTVGIAPLLPGKYQSIGLLLFTAAFFLLTFWVAYQENSLLSRLGKILNPLFLILLLAVFIVAFMHPFGVPSHQIPASAYRLPWPSFVNGFLQGYNTMDALGGLAFGITVVSAVRSMGQKKPSSIAKVTARAGFFGMMAIALIYIALILLGAMSLGTFSRSADGGIAFSQIVNRLAGRAGQIVLAFLITLTCLTTAVGLVAAFAQDFHRHFTKISYHQWLFIVCLLSFATANMGLTQIISWSLPVLMFLYPLAMVLILLSVCSPLFQKDGRVYKSALLLTAISSLLDFLAALPAFLQKNDVVASLLKWRRLLPLASIGLSWVLPAFIGTIAGLIWHWRSRKEKLV